MKVPVQEDNVVKDSRRSIQEAECAVLSSIAVRENHKTKLLALLSIVAPQSFPENKMPGRWKKRSSPSEIHLPEVPTGKEIHVLGDLLLLVRAASVDVVENIQLWREVVHQGLPRPYIYENENYLLVMCEDLDFLDQVGDLVEWLGFRLARNPFIVPEALDGIVTSRLGINVHEYRSLKYWNSASWPKNTNLTDKQRICRNSKSREDGWRKHPPPQPLVTPLASIQPEDDVADGSRVQTAQEVLLEEESFHGRLRSLAVLKEYIIRGPSKLEHSGPGNNEEYSTIYEEIAAVKSQNRTTAYQSALVRRERTQVQQLLQDLYNQIKWTELRLENDRVQEHRVWHCRDKYRREALALFARLAEKLQQCLTVLIGEESCLGKVLDKHKSQQSALQIEKDKLRIARIDKKQQEMTSRRDDIRKKTIERSRLLREKKKSSQKQKDFTEPQTPEAKYREIIQEVENDIRVIEAKRSSVQKPIEECDRHSRLEEKRQQSIRQKRETIELKTRIEQDKEVGLERRRTENVAMKHEEVLSRAVERDAKRKLQLKANKARMDRLAACVIFKCTHEMNGKRFLISIYIQNARGYDLESLRIVAYHPSSSAASTMVMTVREFNSLGYGRTSEGLGNYCKWLCLLYEKRRRQFRLVWSGPSCPRPLRLRESDQTLLCVHKEGLKMWNNRADNYALVAMYLRTDNPSTVCFVLSSWHGPESVLMESGIATKCLVYGTDLDIKRDYLGQTKLIWRHHTYHEELQREGYTDKSKVYSGNITIDRAKYEVHIYDTSDKDYTMDLAPKPGSKTQESQQITKQLLVPKQELNPYGIPLPSSSFAELLALTKFEKLRSSPTHDEWKTTVSSKWRSKLTQYIRVLKLTKYACKIGGVFCFVTLFLVQQKREFRAYLLLKITWLSPTPSTSQFRGGVPTQQSLTIALSDYLRCSNISRRITLGLDDDRRSEECPECLAYEESKLQHNDRLHATGDTTFDYSMSCSNCATIQYWRLSAIKHLITHTGAISSESLQLIYHGYCEVCAVMVPPIVLVLGSRNSSWLQQVLEHYFFAFNYKLTGNNVDDVLHALIEHRVAVLFNANCGMTVSSANLFANELHWWLYPDHEELPCHVAYLVGESNFNSEIDLDNQRDADLLEAMKSLNTVAIQMGRQDPVHLDYEDKESGDHASAFDAYLVAEAVLVEATRMLLHQEWSWPKPREIVGASSWSTACKYLLKPDQLSAALQQLKPLALQPSTVEILQAYFMHASWPRDYNDVRPIFYGLLSYMMHLEHVHQILTAKNGSLQNSHHVEMENGEFLAANTSVIDSFYMTETS